MTATKDDKYGYYYLASPYAHPDPGVVQERYQAALRATARLIGQGVYVYSPIVHNHPVNLHAKLTDAPYESRWEFWKNFDKSMIWFSDGVLVLLIDGWRESRGVTEELKFARSIDGCSVRGVTPDGEVVELPA